MELNVTDRVGLCMMQTNMLEATKMLTMTSYMPIVNVFVCFNVTPYLPQTTCEVSRGNAGEVETQHLET